MVWSVDWHQISTAPYRNRIATTIPPHVRRSIMLLVVPQWPVRVTRESTFWRFSAVGPTGQQVAQGISPRVPIIFARISEYVRSKQPQLRRCFDWAAATGENVRVVKAAERKYSGTDMYDLQLRPARQTVAAPTARQISSSEIESWSLRCRSRYGSGIKLLVTYARSLGPGR
jgi:hypothetical protein